MDLSALCFVLFIGWAFLLFLLFLLLLCQLGLAFFIFLLAVPVETC
jgi:hypothetical protein